MTRRLTPVAVVVFALCAAAANATPPTPIRVELATVTSSACSRTGIATTAMGFLGLLNERRYQDSRLLWLPKRRLPTPGFFYVASTTGRATIRAEIGTGIPRAVRTWTADGFSLAEMILVDARPNPREPANSGLVIAWIRYPDSGEGPVLLGRGKGVWDCEKRRLAMWVGSETPVADEAEARETAAGQCRRRPNNTVIRRFNQQARLCGKPRISN